MIANLVRQYIARPIAAVVRRLPFEPVVIAGVGVEFLLLLQADLENGVQLEEALTGILIAIGTRILRQSVWPNARVSVDGVADSALEAPITGVPD